MVVQERGGASDLVLCSGWLLQSAIAGCPVRCDRLQMRADSPQSVSQQPIGTLATYTDTMIVQEQLPRRGL